MLRMSGSISLLGRRRQAVGCRKKKEKQKEGTGCSLFFVLDLQPMIGYWFLPYLLVCIFGQNALI